MVSASGLLLGVFTGVYWMSPVITSLLMPSWFRCSFNYTSSCCLLCMPRVSHTWPAAAVQSAAWAALFSFTTLLDREIWPSRFPGRVAGMVQWEVPGGIMGRPSYLGLQTSFLKSFEITKNASVLNSAFLNKLSLTSSSSRRAAGWWSKALMSVGGWQAPQSTANHCWMTAPISLDTEDKSGLHAGYVLPTQRRLLVSCVCVHRKQVWNTSDLGWTLCYNPNRLCNYAHEAWILRQPLAVREHESAERRIHPCLTTHVLKVTEFADNAWWFRVAEDWRKIC